MFLTPHKYENIITYPVMYVNTEKHKVTW